MKHLAYTTEVHSLDYGYLTVEYDYFEADDSVGLSETFDWFAYTTEAYPNQHVGTDVTYELCREDQAFILAQIKKHHAEIIKEYAHD